MTTDDVAKDRAVALFGFLRELAELSTKTVRNCEEYERVIWLNDIPRHLNVRRMAWHNDHGDESSDTWLEIKKPDLKSPPNVPASVRRWVLEDELDNPDLDRPSLRERIPAMTTEEVAENQARQRFVFLSDQPEIQQTWSDYVEGKWEPWAIEERVRRSVQEVYASLFSLYQKQVQLGEEYEILVGSGLLEWKAHDTIAIKRHILVAQANLSFDSGKAIMSVGPPGDGANLKLEHDMLEIGRRPPVLPGDFSASLDEIGNGIWDKSKMGNAIRKWVNSLSASATYREAMSPQSNVTGNPTVSLAPALILRRRSEKGIVAVLRAIGEQLQSASSIPLTIGRLVSQKDCDSRQGDHQSSALEEIYFTKRVPHSLLMSFLPRGGRSSWKSPMIRKRCLQPNIYQKRTRRLQDSALNAELPRDRLDCKSRLLRSSQRWGCPRPDDRRIRSSRKHPWSRLRRTCRSRYTSPCLLQRCKMESRVFRPW